MIKKWLEYINEGQLKINFKEYEHYPISEEDIEDMFLEMIDAGYEIGYYTGFFNERTNGSYSSGGFQNEFCYNSSVTDSDGNITYEILYTTNVEVISTNSYDSDLTSSFKSAYRQLVEKFDKVFICDLDGIIDIKSIKKVKSGFDIGDNVLFESIDIMLCQKEILNTTDMISKFNITDYYIKDGKAYFDCHIRDLYYMLSDMRQQRLIEEDDDLEMYMDRNVSTETLLQYYLDDDMIDELIEIYGEPVNKGNMSELSDALGELYEMDEIKSLYISMEESALREECYNDLDNAISKYINREITTIYNLGNNRHRLLVNMDWVFQYYDRLSHDDEVSMPDLLQDMFTHFYSKFEVRVDYPDYGDVDVKKFHERIREHGILK